jgi:hypothetical protein
MSEHGQQIWDNLEAAKDEIINNNALVEVWTLKDVYDIAKRVDKTLTVHEANNIMLYLHAYVDEESPICREVIETCILTELGEPEDT